MSGSGPIVVLIGPPGAGKTLVGKLLAKLLRAAFIDTDRRIVDKHGPISTIFAERGEHEFRAMERIEVAQALGETGVVALGGGSVLDPQTQHELAKLRVAYLTVSAEAASRRIRGTMRLQTKRPQTKRPLLAGGMGSWLNIMNERREIYERLATHTVDSSHRSAKSIAQELAQWIQQEEKA